MDYEAALFQRLRQGDAAAVAEFGESKRPQLSAYVAHHLGAALRAKVEPDDVVQEALLRSVQNAQLFATTERDPFGVLCHLAEQAIIDAHRKLIDAQKRAAGREVPLQGGTPHSDGGGIIDLLVASMTSASAAFSRNQRELRMWEALDTLPEDQREALRLRYVDGLPTKEIALRLHKTDGAIRVMLTRSLDKLQHLLGQSGA
jgi:RNA polymerase sigma-70 factor (ECF subfamily)